MDWQSLPPSENVEDRRNNPLPFWAYLGLEEDPYKAMIKDLFLQNPFQPSTRLRDKEETKQKLNQWEMNQNIDPGPLGRTLGTESINIPPDFYPPQRSPMDPTQLTMPGKPVYGPMPRQDWFIPNLMPDFTKLLQGLQLGVQPGAGERPQVSGQIPLDALVPGLALRGSATAPEQGKPPDLGLMLQLGRKFGVQ